MDLKSLHANYQPYDITGWQKNLPPPKKPPGGLAGILAGLAKSIAHPIGYVGDAAFGTPIREISAQLTGNKEAYKNAGKRANKNLGLGEQGTNIGSGLKQWAGNSAQLGLMALAPGSTSIKGGAAVGAGFGGSSALAQNGSLEDVLRQAVIGSAVGGVVGGVSGAFNRSGSKTAAGVVGGVDNVSKAAKLSAGPNATARAGNSLYRSTLGIDDIVMPGKLKPGTIFKADELATEARRIGLKGTPKAMQRQVGKQYDFLNKDISGILSKSKGTTSASTIIKQAEKDILSKLPVSTKEFPVRTEFLRSLSPLGKGKVNAKALYDFKNSLGVDSAFKKLSTGGNLTAKETVDLALWKQADDWITKLAPAAKELTTRQSKLYGLAQGLGRMTRTPGDPQNLSNLAIRIGSPTARGAQNMAGRALMRIGGEGAAPKIASTGTGALSGALSKLSNVPKMGLAANPAMALALKPSGGQDNNTDPGLEMSSSLDENRSEASNQQAPQLKGRYPLEQAIADLQAHPDPKSRKNIMDYYDFVNSAEQAEIEARGGGKLTAQEKKAQKQADTALQGLKQLRNLYGGAGGGAGRVEGILKNITGKGGANSKANAFNQIRNSLTTTLARAFGETGVLTDQDREVYLQALPRLEDNPEEAKIKLQYLEDMLAGS